VSCNHLQKCLLWCYKLFPVQLQIYYDGILFHPTPRNTPRRPRRGVEEGVVNTTPRPLYPRERDPLPTGGHYTIIKSNTSQTAHNSSSEMRKTFCPRTPRKDTRIILEHSSGVPRGWGGWGVQPPRNSEVLTKLSRIPRSVENTSVTT
jgi:hypothetical protein